MTTVPALVMADDDLLLVISSGDDGDGEDEDDEDDEFMLRLHSPVKVPDTTYQHDSTCTKCCEVLVKDFIN